jgi:quercetin dioxygenase-like cupin family protein
MKINRGREAGKKSELRSDYFTGVVWADPVLESTGDVLINNVFFAPGARTHWHKHAGGQVLYVTSGQGKVYNREGNGATIGVGDTIYIAPAEEHWHGADAGTYLVHLAVSLGASDWLEPVTDEEYGIAERALDETEPAG